MRIEDVTDIDLPVLGAIEQSAAKQFLDIPDLAWLAQGSVQSVERHRELIQLGTNWVVRHDNGKPVGFLSAEILGDQLHIWEISVHADFQGRGLGRALIEHAIAQARLKALSAVSLTTFIDVPWNAPFYARLGFRIQEADVMSERLKNILNTEKTHGLPVQRRCAMLLDITP